MVRERVMPTGINMGIVIQEMGESMASGGSLSGLRSLLQYLLVLYP